MANGTSIDIQLPPKLIPVFQGEALYRGAYGGRGSGKTKSFAIMTAVKAIQFARAGRTGVIFCAREYQKSLADSSFAEIRKAILENEWLRHQFKITERTIKTTCGRISYAFDGLRYNVDAIKSVANILLLWVDEAEPVSETAWIKADNTVREAGSEVWVTWNPEKKNSATDKRFKQNPPENSKIVEINFEDNPWFPDELNQKRLEDLEKRPEQYPHIWLGDYATAHQGAYYAKLLIEAHQQKRILDELHIQNALPLRSFHDIGGAGRNSDAYTIWVYQVVGDSIHILDYYEAVGQVIGEHVAWMEANGYGRAEIVLPHDGAAVNNQTGKSTQDFWREAGFSCRVLENQGRGAAAKRIDAGRNIFGKCIFHENNTSAGRDALGYYHEKWDDVRQIGLGPEHDWSSHGADAFGGLAVDYLARERIMKGSRRTLRYRKRSYA